MVFFGRFFFSSFFLGGGRGKGGCVGFFVLVFSSRLKDFQKNWSYGQ